MSVPAHQQQSGQLRAEPFEGSAFAEALETMHLAAEDAGVEFDALAAREALRRSVAAHPGDWNQTWTARLQQVAEALELNAVAGRRTLREIVELPRAGSPIIVRLPSAGAVEHWCVLSDRRLRKVLVLTTTGQQEWVTPRALLKRTALPDPHAAIDFLSLQAAAPCEAAASEGHERFTPQQRLWRLMRLDSRDIWMVVVFAIGVGILSLATPITVELLVNSIAFGNLMQPVIILSLLLFVSLGFVVGMQLIQTYVVEILQRRFFVRTMADLAYRLPRVQRSALIGRYGPELTNRFLDVAIFQKTAASLLMDGLFIVLQAIVGMTVLAFYHPYLLGYDVVILAAISAIIFVLGRGATSTAVRESEAKYDSLAWLQDLSRQPVSIKMGGGPEMALSTADHYAKEWLEARGDHFRVVLRQIIGSMGLQVVSSTVLLGLGGWLVIQRELTLGQLVAAELIVTNIVLSFAKFGKHFEAFYDLLAATNKLGHLFDLSMERTSGETVQKTNAASGMSLTSVDFGYPGRELTFKDLNLEIHAGESTAVVGDTGCGKSTLFQLLYGMWNPTGGFVTLDGNGLRQMSLSSLRSQIALVQSVEFASSSILENVRWGRDQLTHAEVSAALEAVGLLDTMRDLPDGLETRLLPDGSPLSGGQARAVVIARAVVGMPRVLMIDGVLDQMDGRLLEYVLDCIFDPEAPWTLLVATSHEAVRHRCRRSLDLTAQATHAAEDSLGDPDVKQDD